MLNIDRSKAPHNQLDSIPLGFESEFLAGYIACALWSSNNSNGQPLNVLDISIPFDVKHAMAVDCTNFQVQSASFLEEYYDFGFSESGAGHDFWLTRNGHGTGFWDRGLPDKLGQALTKAAHDFGEQTLLVENGEVLIF